MLTTSTILNTFNQGGAAQRIGTAVSVNPYHCESPLAFIWTAGWVAQQDQTSPLSKLCRNGCQPAQPPHTRRTPPHPKKPPHNLPRNPS